MLVDVSKAISPSRHRREGPTADTEGAREFQRQYPVEARRYNWMQNQVLWPERDAAINPNKADLGDLDKITQHIKDFAKEVGADVVGVAEMDKNFVFKDTEAPPHSRVLAFGLAMKFDMMSDIGQNSQQEVHRVYFKMLDIAVRIAQYIGGFGYSAWAHPNAGELAHVPMAYLAGLGELGKHGSLINPEFGSSWRLALVSTDMPLVMDGPKDFGIDAMCDRCTVCTRFCPGEALAPEKQLVNGVLRWHVDTAKCEPYFQRLWGCKICLMVCPFNGRGAFKEGYKGIAKELAKAKDYVGYLPMLAQGTPEAAENLVLSKYLDK